MCYMKNIKEIADILGVSKMTVYRFIKTSNISESAVEGRTMLYDDTSVSAIIKAFYDKKDATHDTIDDTSDYAQEYLKKLEEMNAFFKKEIEDKKQQLKAKDEQIERLQIILDQQQQLLLYEQKKSTLLIEENISISKKRSWWTWWK